MVAKVGKLNVILTASSRGFNRGLSRAGKAVASFRSNTNKLLSGIGGGLTGTVGKISALTGAVGLGGLGIAFKSAADNIDNITKSARKLLGNTGATGALRGIRLAAEEAGVSNQNLDKSFEKLADTMASAKGGNKTAQKLFTDLGISMNEVRASSPDKLFTRVGDAIKSLPSPDEKIGAARDIFGKTGGDLIELFNQGSGAIRQAQADVQRFGLALSAIEANKVEQMNDSFGRSRMMLTGLMEQLVVRMAPALTAISERFIDWVDKIGGAGQAAQNLYDFIVEGSAGVLDTIESFEIAWLKVKRAIQGAYASLLEYVTKKAGGDGSAAREAELQKRAQGIAPGKRAEFIRRARESGGFQDERVSIKRVGEAFRASAEDTDAQIAAAEKRKREKGSLGTRFKEFLLEADDTATKKAKDFQEKLTGEYQKRLDIQKELNKAQEAGQGRAALQAFNGPVTAFNEKMMQVDAIRGATQDAGGSGGEKAIVGELRGLRKDIRGGVPAAYG